MTEALVATTLGALVVAAMLPALSDSLRRARFDAAVRTIVTDIRDTRSRAITSGWEYQLVGRETSNQYRILGRSSTAVAWPDLSSAPLETPTQFAGEWVNVGDEFDGVTVDSEQWTFSVTFDARGAATQSNFSPLAITNGHDKSSTITVSAVGGISVQ